MELKEMIWWAIFGKNLTRYTLFCGACVQQKSQQYAHNFVTSIFNFFCLSHQNFKNVLGKSCSETFIHPPKKNQNWKLLLPLITSTITQFKFLFVLLLPCSLVFQMYYIDIVIQFQAKGSVIFMSMQPDVILSLLRKKSAAYRPEKTVKRTLFAAQRIHRGHQLK